MVLDPTRKLTSRYVIVTVTLDSTNVLDTVLWYLAIRAWVTVCMLILCAGWL